MTGLAACIARLTAPVGEPTADETLDRNSQKSVYARLRATTLTLRIGALAHACVHGSLGERGLRSLRRTAASIASNATATAGARPLVAVHPNRRFDCSQSVNGYTLYCSAVFRVLRIKLSRFQLSSLYLLIEIQVSLLYLLPHRRASIRRKCIGTAPPTTANTWG